MPKIKLSGRPANSEDEDFLYELHKAAMRSYVEATWGVWAEDWQRAYFKQHFHPELLRILRLNQTDIGVMQVEERSEEIFLANLEILPAFQNKGIGTNILRRLIARAARQRKPVALQVLKVNLAARALYQRLGFGITGENETHYIMAYEHNHP